MKDATIYTLALILGLWINHQLCADDVTKVNDKVTDIENRLKHIEELIYDDKKGVESYE